MAIYRDRRIMHQPIIDILTIAALLTASYTDMKRQEIPLGLFPLLFAVALYIRLYYNVDTYSMTGYAIGAAVMFLAAIAGVHWTYMGGGDLIMMVVLGFILGIDKLVLTSILILAEITIYILFEKFAKKKKTFLVPVAPFYCIAIFLYDSIAFFF